MGLPRLCRQRRHVGADPVGDRGRHGAAQDRRRLHRNPPLVRQHHRLQPHQVLAAAAAGALDVGDAGGDRDRIGQRQPAGRRRRRRGGLFGRLVGSGGRFSGSGLAVPPVRSGLLPASSGDRRGASAGRGRGNGTAAAARRGFFGLRSPNKSLQGP